tara:strand:+ start:7249 stop:7491 length:243 start_codon:yes stop_codon:yes gene_type:complete
MIAYDIDTDGSVSIKIRKEVSAMEMDSLAFTIEAFTEGNPKTTIYFRLEKGLPIRWIKYVERLCENIPNSHSILREINKI